MDLGAEDNNNKKIQRENKIISKKKDEQRRTSTEMKYKYRLKFLVLKHWFHLYTNLRSPETENNEMGTLKKTIRFFISVDGLDITVDKY